MFINRQKLLFFTNKQMTVTSFKFRGFITMFEVMYCDDVTSLSWKRNTKTSEAFQNRCIWTALNQCVDEKKYTAHHLPPTIHHLTRDTLLRIVFPKNFEATKKNSSISASVFSRIFSFSQPSNIICCRYACVSPKIFETSNWE